MQKREVALREWPTGEPVRAACEAVLRALPKWFGVEAAIVDYVLALSRMPTWTAHSSKGGAVVGFLSLELHDERTAEIHVMGVLESHHRAGVGRLLVACAESFARASGRSRLEVKTLGPSHPDASYAKTRAFYGALGFVPLEERTDVWGPQNPCLIMVKAVAQSGTVI